MLVLKLLKESFFLKVLEAILDLVDVVSVDCSDTGLTLQAMNAGQIAVVKLFIPAEDFSNAGDVFECDEVHSVGIPIDDMVKVIGCTDGYDTITIKLDDDRRDTITLSFESSPRNITMVYDFRVVDASDRLLYIPDREVLDSNYQAIVQMPSAEFMRVCQCLNDIKHVFHISVTETDIMFIAHGGSGDFRVKRGKATTPVNVTYMEKELSLTLTLDSKCMYNIAKASTVLDDVKICLSTAHPLMVECMGSKMGKMSYMRYFLAPEMCDEENEGSAEDMEGIKDEPRVFN